MARTQSQKRRLIRFVKPSNSTSGLASSPGPSDGPVGDFASVPEPLGMASPGALARMKRFFNRSNQGSPTTIGAEIAGTGTSGRVQKEQEQPQAALGLDAAAASSGGGAQAQEETSQTVSTKDVEKSIAKPEPEHAPTSAGKDVDAAVESLRGIDRIPRVVEGAVVAVGTANTTFSDIQNLSDTYLKPFKAFNQVVSTLANIHPYAQIALGILTSAAQLLMNQANPDNGVSRLLDTVRGVYEFLTETDSVYNIDPMRDILAKIARVTSDSTQFICNYPATKSFWKRSAKSVFAETETFIDGYVKTLDSLMQLYRDRAVRDIQVNTYRIFEDLNLDGMAYAGGAGLNTTKKCLDGTRQEILQEIVSWINDPGVDARIFWLYGQAGRGKSAIAHTVASWIKDVGGLGSCFCFARDRQAEHREEKILTTIARDLADRDLAFRRALAEVVSNDFSLKTTPDVAQQWQQLILEPLSKVNGATVGNVVVVIDALDESGPDTSREQILSLLTSPEAAHLPSNFRILLTSRPLPDIEHVLSAAAHVKATSLDDISAVSAERDIRLYVSTELRRLPEIGAREVQSIARKSNGLFEWARLACRFIKSNRRGRTVVERYNEVMFPHSGDREALLDAMYRTILEDMVPLDEATLAQFRSVMQQVMTSFEPLQLDALNEIRSHFPSEKDHFDMIIILEFMAPLLSGISDRCSVVRPLHASFYDFLSDHSRSGVYFVGASSADIQNSLAFASLQTLCVGLKFNICGLDSSYSCNSEVADLLERANKSILPSLSYSCCYWAHHLQRAVWDVELATLVKAVIGSEKILFWLETLSLLNELGHATSALACTIIWLQGQGGFEDMLALAEDGIKFIHNFSSAISHSAPHLYISALPFIPPSTVLSRLLMPRFFGLAMVAAGGLKRWPVAQLTLDGHTDSVYAVAFSPDGRKIVSGSKDRTVRIWDAERGLETGSPLEGHTSAVFSVAFSPDGKKIVSGSRDKTLRIWGADGGGSIGIPLVGHTDAVESTAFSHDGKQIISGSRDKTVRVWDAERGMIIGSPIEEHNSAVFSVAFSPDGRRFVSGLEDGTVMVRDVMGNMLFSGPIGHHAGAVKSVAFSPDGKKIVSGSLDKTVRIWDAERGGPIGSPIDGHSSAVFSVAFSPSGKRIISGSWDSTVIVWDTEAGVLVDSPLQGHTNAVNSVAFSHDGKRIVSGSGDRTIRIWDAERGGQNGSSPQGHTQVKAVAPSSGYEGIVPVPHDHHVISVHEESEVLACNTSSALVPSYATDIVKRCFICFSSKSSHVLHDSEQLLDGLQLEDDNVRDEPVKLQDDGWIRGPKGKLLLWIHPTLRRPFYSMWNGVTISRGGCVELDLSQMVHGNKWHMCFKEIV